MKFIVLSFKINGLLNIMKTRSGRSQDSIFHEFVIVLGGMEELLDDMSCLLEVGFSMDFEEVPWLRHRGQVRVNPWLVAPPRSAMAEAPGSGEGKFLVGGPTNKQLGDISENI